MSFQSLARATPTLALAPTCGPRPRDGGPPELVYMEGMDRACPMGPRSVCDEGTTVCICEALGDAGATPNPSEDDGVAPDARTDGVRCLDRVHGPGAGALGGATCM